MFRVFFRREAVIFLKLDFKAFSREARKKIKPSFLKTFSRFFKAFCLKMLRYWVYGRKIGRNLSTELCCLKILTYWVYGCKNRLKFSSGTCRLKILRYLVYGLKNREKFRSEANCLKILRNWVCGRKNR